MTTIKICSVEGCAEPARSRGWCDKHYNRWRRHGDPTVVLQAPPTCGTYGGYQKHKRQGEVACEECRKAGSEYARTWRQGNPEARQREREATAAYSRALWRLAHAHPEEFQRLAAEERAGDKLR